MNRLRVVTLCAAVTFFLVAVAVLQADKPDKGDKKPPKDAPAAAKVEVSAVLVPAEILDKLELKDEQKEKIAKLQKEFGEKTTEGIKKVEEARTAAGKDKAALKKVEEDEKALADSTNQLRKDMQAKIAEVLNEDQKKKFDELKAEMSKEPEPSTEPEPSPDKKGKDKKGKDKKGKDKDKKDKEKKDKEKKKTPA